MHMKKDYKIYDHLAYSSELAGFFYFVDTK